MTVATEAHKAHQRAEKRTEIEERRAQVARMLVRHLSYRDIGTELGVSHQTVANDVNAIRQRWATQASTDFDAMRRREEFKLDEMERALMPLLDRKERVEAVRALIRVADRRAKLLGLDSPARVEHTGAEGGPIEVMERAARLGDQVEAFARAQAEAPVQESEAAPNGER